jgi:carbon storage regulator CsrA
MLVLSIKEKQGHITLHAPNCEPITVRLVGVKSGKVQIGIEAPKEVLILRSDAKRKGEDDEVGN